MSQNTDPDTPRETNVPPSQVAMAHNTSPTQNGTSATPHTSGPNCLAKPFTKKRRGTNASHVNVDFFDPEGVRQLNRTLTGMSAQGNGATNRQAESCHSDDTLSPGEPFDFEKTLKALVKKRDEANIMPRELGVLFNDLKVVGLGATAAYQSTFGSVLNPVTIFEQIQAIRRPPLRDILKGFEGVVRPGEMLLVLGRPGSGCSTFLKVLANHRDEYHAVEGDVYYDSLTPEQISNHYRGDVQYCPEDDVHFPTLTVKQTLDFAAKTRLPHVRIQPSKSRYVNMFTEMLSTIFGLKHVQNTPVGDAAIRGISGGEKKRVSIAEALATRSRVHSWDNSTRGLDSSTALEFGRALRIATDLDNRATIASIYQASESLYQLFDKVCIIYEGRMAYFGPADQARQYFIDMGYEPANRQTTPDFLVAVTDPNGRIPRADLDINTAPRTAAEFAEYFLKSPIAQQNREDMEQYKEAFVGVPERAIAYKQSVRAEHAKSTRKKSPYTISILMQARAVMLRRAQILLGNMTATYLLIFSFIFQGVIVGTVFLDIPETTAAYFSRGGVLFFALLFSALSSLAEIPALFNQRPIVHRHEKAAMYHPAIEALALTIVDLPITLATSIVFSILIYFIVGLQKSAGQFFIFLLFLFTMTVVMRAWFRTVAAAFKSEATAQGLSGVILIAMVLYTGYTIPKTSMIGALRWIIWVNPLRYGFEGIIANEFHTLNGTCASFVPQGPGYENVPLANRVCTTVGSVTGQATVDGNTFVKLAFDYSYSVLWRNFGIMCAYGFGFAALLLLFSEYNTAISGETFMVLFKRGSQSLVLKEAAETISGDEEKSSATKSFPSIDEPDNEKMEKALASTPEMHDIFSWQHLGYTVPVSGGHRKLLDDVSGFVVPGKLTALMGESGAGKTTLLNVLAQRIDTGVVEGDRFVNGQAPPHDFQAKTGYCQQLDTHMPTDTVREALRVSALLRQPSSVPVAEKEAYVEECLKMCGLEAFADAAIGSLGVEHRKRTTIGVELAAKPKLLLFLDEPTSGLDSQSAWAIMGFLRKLADSGQAILCTIHQPSAELFQVFDKLLLLRKGGQTVYFGDLGHNATKLINYFEKNGSRHCEPAENPAEFMLDVIGAGATATSSQDWHAIWKKSPEAVEVQQKLDEIHAEGKGRPPLETTLRSEFATSWYNQFEQLFLRSCRGHWRDPTYLMSKLILNIFSGVFIGFTFFKAKNTQQGTQDQLFAVFMSTLLSAPLSNQIQVPFLNLRNVYEIRERPSRMYSWSALITAQFFSELPWNVLGSSLYFLCWYWTVGFDNSRAGFTYLMLGVAYPIYYTAFAMSVAAMAPSAEIAALLFSVLFSFVVTFNGVLQPFRELGWWKWMYHLSPFTYLIEALLGQALGRKPINCSPIELVTLEPPSGQTCQAYLQSYIEASGGYLTNPNASSSCEFCAFATTDEFLSKNFNIFYSHHWRDFGIFTAYILFNIAAMYFFTYWFRIRKGSLLGSLKARLSRSSS